MNTVISFLQAHGSYEFELPDGIDSAPAATSVIAAFRGEREIGYVPDADVDAIGGGQVHLYDVVEDERVVSVYETPGPVPSYSVFWRLSGGWMITFMNEPTPTLEAVAALIDNVRIRDDAPGVPRIELQPPLARTARKDPGYYDLTTFRSRVSRQPLTVDFREVPGTRRSGRGRTVDGPDAQAWTYWSGMLVRVQGPSDAVDDALTQVTDMLAPAPAPAP